MAVLTSRIPPRVAAPAGAFLVLDPVGTWPGCPDPHRLVTADLDAAIGAALDQATDDRRVVVLDDAGREVGWARGDHWHEALGGGR
jgi:hypothetical protein